MRLSSDLHRQVFFSKQSEYLLRQGLRISHRRNESRHFMDDHPRNTASCGRHHRHAAGHRFDDRERSIVEEGCVNKEVSAFVPSRHLFVWDGATKLHGRESKAPNQSLQVSAQRPISDQIQYRVGLMCLYHGKGMNDHINSIVRAQVPRAEYRWKQVRSGTIVELITDDVGHNGDGQAGFRKLRSQIG